MSTAVQALAVFLPLAYFAAAFLYGMHFGGRRAPSVEVPRRLALALALGLHLALGAGRWLQLSTFPVQDPWSTLSGIALGMVLLHVVASSRPGTGRRAKAGALDEAAAEDVAGEVPLAPGRWGHRGSVAGSSALVLATAGLLQTLASAFAPLAPPVAPDGPQAFRVFHVVTSLVAASALGLSGIHGWLYLVAFRRIRRHRFDPLVRGLPSLRHLSSMTRRSALLGFLLLTVGLNVGIAWAHNDELQSFHYSDPWVLAMLAIWIHFGVVAFSGSIPGLTARRTSLAAALGLAVFLSAGALTLIPEVTFHWRP